MGNDVSYPTAFCKVHGFFPCTAFAMAAGASVTIKGMSTNCPQCGQNSEIIPGAYSALPDGISLLVDPSISPQALTALRNVVERLQNNKITVEEAKKEAEKVVPGTGKFFDLATWNDQAKATLFESIIGAIAVVTAAKLASSASPPVVNSSPVIERIIERPTSGTAIALMLAEKKKLEEQLKTFQQERLPKHRPEKTKKRR